MKHPSETVLLSAQMIRNTEKSKVMKVCKTISKGEKGTREKE